MKLLLLIFLSLLSLGDAYNYYLSQIRRDVVIELHCRGDDDFCYKPNETYAHDWYWNNQYIASFYTNNYSSVSKKWNNLVKGNFTHIVILDPPVGYYCCNLFFKYEHCFTVKDYAPGQKLRDHWHAQFLVPTAESPPEPDQAFAWRGYLLTCIVLVWFYVFYYLAYIIYRRRAAGDPDAFSLTQFFNHLWTRVTNPTTSTTPQPEKQPLPV
ncbi:E3 gp19K [Squirrel monkey adenovirus]|nr:E3 gp19K [Squirrel monkey adenovirus]